MHQAADGGLARVRLAGGQLTSAGLLALADAASDLGDGSLELTSRGNVQVRGLAPGAEVELGLRLAAVGLLPSESHERVRNIVSSPLSGLDDVGRTDVSGLAVQLDVALCARPGLAALPGRFLFAIDDGRGDVAGLAADVTAFALNGPDFAVLVGRQSTGFVVPRAEIVAAMLAVAEAFLDQLSDLDAPVWRIAELPDGGQALLERLNLGPRIEAHLPPPPADPAPGPQIPPSRCMRGRRASTHAPTCVVLAPLGRLTADQARLLASSVASAGCRVTPSRSIVLIDASVATVEFERAGLAVRPDSPWLNVSACTGRPGCAKALADVQADARAEVEAGSDRFGGRRVRWSGCARKCGRPRNTEIDLIATENGYEVIAT
ncbi:MAG: cobG [Pseudonocardiales bacterium]|nr:cobG [Pseudonocardiales bacterium]